MPSHSPEDVSANPETTQDSELGGEDKTPPPDADLCGEVDVAERPAEQNASPEVHYNIMGEAEGSNVCHRMTHDDDDVNLEQELEPKVPLSGVSEETSSPDKYEADRLCPLLH